MKQKLATVDYLFVESPPLPTSAAKGLPIESESKVVQKRHGLYLVLSVPLEYLQIFVKVVKISVSIKCARYVA